MNQDFHSEREKESLRKLDFDVNFIFSKEFTAELQISSSDKAFKHNEIPKVFNQIPEKEIIWEYIRSPSSNDTQIYTRQACIKEFLEHDQLYDLIQNKNISYSLNNSLSKLSTIIHTSEWDESGVEAITVIRNPNEYSSEVVSHAEEIFNSAIEQIEAAKKAAMKVYSILSSSNAPASEMFARELSQFNELLDSLTEENIRSDDFEVFNAVSNAQQHTSILIQAGVFFELAEVLSSSSFCFPTNNSELPIQYKEAHNILCPESINYRNDSPEDKLCVMYGSINKSGKSETGLKLPFSMQLLFQSFGIGSAKSANLPIYESMHYLDRPTSDAVNNLSSYTSEMTEQGKMFNSWIMPSCVWLDEPGSSTSPNEQHYNIVAKLNIMREKNIKVYVATHEEQTLKLGEEHPDIEIYHFPVDFADAANPVYSYKLKKGFQDSESFRVLHAEGFDPDILNRANDHLENGNIVVNDRTHSVWPSIAPFSPGERFLLKEQSASTKNIFKKASPNEQVYSYYGSRKDGNAIGIQTYRAGLDEYAFNHSEWTFRIEIDNEFLTNALFLVKTPSPQESIERSQLLKQLESEEIFKKLCKTRASLEYLSYGIRGLSNSSSVIEFANELLNPFAGRHLNINTGGDVEEEINLSFHYLKVMEALYGDGYVLISETKRCEELKLLFNNCILEIESLTVGEINNRLNEYSKIKADDKLISIVNKFLVKHKQNPVKAEKQITYNSIYRIYKNLSKYIPHYPDEDENPLAEIYSVLNSSFNLDELEGEFSRLGSEMKLSNLTLREVREYCEKRDGLDERYPPGNVYASLLQTRNFLPIKDSQIIEDIKKFGIVTSTYNLDCLEIPIRELADTLKLDIPKILLPINLFSTNLSKLKENLIPLCEFIINNGNTWDRDSPESWQRELQAALGLYSVLEHGNSILEIIEELRSKDNIYLHQITNEMESLLHSLWSSDNFYGEQMLNDLSQGDDNLRLWYLHKSLLQALGKETDDKSPPENVRELIDELNIGDLRNIIKFCTMALERKDTEIVDDLTEEAQLFISDYARYKYRYQSHGYGENRIHFSPLSYTEENKQKEEKQLKEKAYTILSTYSHLSYRSAEELDLDRDAKEIFDLVNNNEVNDFLNISLNVGYHSGPLDSIAKNVDHLISLSALAKDFTEEYGWSEVEFSENGDFIAEDFSAPRGHRDYHPQSISFNLSNSFTSLQSPHSSGKTTCQNALSENVALGLSIGRAKAKNIIIPPFSGVTTIQRVAAKTSEKESGLTSDKANWNPVIERAKKAPHPLFMTIDEPFTTIPFKYKVPLTHTLIAEFYERGHYGLVADHCHDMLNELTRLYPGFTQKHFAYNRNEEGEVTFTRDIKDGPAPSMALEILAMYIPSEYLSYFYEVRGKQTY